jgi:hypothetical protein
VDIDLDGLLSLDEAADIVGRSPTTLRWAARTGNLPAKRLGRDWVTTHESVAYYAAMHARGAVFGVRRRDRRVI